MHVHMHTVRESIRGRAGPAAADSREEAAGGCTAPSLRGDGD